MFTFLACTVSSSSFTGTWSRSGTVLVSGGKYTQDVSLLDGGTSQLLLVVQMLSYNDAGNYTCVVHPSPPNGSEAYSATIQLILLGELLWV